jgi:hypothetical protein
MNTIQPKPILLFFVSLFIGGATAQTGKPVPYGLPCIPTSYVTSNITSTPDLGIIVPHTLVRTGTTVKLHGLAAETVILSNCSIANYEAAYTWTLTFIPYGGNPIDVTTQLIDPLTLNPTFKAAGPGKYIVHFLFTYPAFIQYSKEQIIEVIKPEETWVDIGVQGLEPGGGMNYPFTGRCNSLNLSKGSSNLFAGSALGGLWKFDNPDNLWYQLTNNKGLPNLGTGPIEIAPDGTIFMGTGDLHPGNGIYESGGGVFKSTDKGLTWTPVGQSVTGCSPTAVSFAANAQKILVDPAHPGTIYIGTNIGLFRSTNNGDCWVSFSSLSVTDMIINPLNPADLFFVAPAVGVFDLVNAAGTAPTIKTIFSFPSSASWSLIRIAPSSPNVIYVSAANGDASAVLYKSIDGGASFPATGSVSLPCSRQCSYGMALAIDPGDANHLVYGEVGPHQSIDGGRTFTPLAADGSSHVDYHDLAFDPNDRTWVYAATDGGVHRLQFQTGPNYAPVNDWQNIDNGLANSQVAEYADAPVSSVYCSGGLWDNGTQLRNSGRNWASINGGDGYVVSADAENLKTVYFNENAGDGGDTRRSPDGYDFGQAGAVLANPFLPGELFGFVLGSKGDSKLYVSENSYATTSGSPWVCADPLSGDGSQNFSVEFSPDHYYYATYRTGAIVRFTIDPAKLIYSKCTLNQTAASAPEQVYISPTTGIPTLSNDPFTSNSIYALVRLDNGQFNLLKITKGSAGWVAQDISGDITANTVLSGAILADPLVPGRVLLGDKHGLWIGSPSSSGAYHWAMDPDIPDTWVTTIASHRNSAGGSTLVRLSTFGRGVWERVIANYGLICHECFTWIYRKFPLPDEPLKRISNPDRSMWLAVNYDNAENSKGLYITATPIVGKTIGRNTIFAENAFAENAFADKIFADKHAVLKDLKITSQSFFRKSNGEPQFFSQAVSAIAGQGSALVHIWLADGSKISGFTTDSVRVEMTDARGQVLFANNYPMHFAWSKPGEAVLHVSSRAGSPGPTEKNIQIMVSQSGRKEMVYTTPFDIIAPLHSVVRLSAPHSLDKCEKDIFLSWQESGKNKTNERIITLPVKTSAVLTAVYQSEEKE